MKPRINKKGFVQLFIAGLVFCLFFLLLGIYLVTFSPIQHKIMNLTRENTHSTQADAIIDNVDQHYDGWMDGAFVLIFTILWVVGLVIGYHSEQGPFLMLIFFILIVFVLMVAGQLSDYWKDYVDENDAVATRAYYPMTYYLLDNLMWSLLIVFASGLAVNILKN